MKKLIVLMVLLCMSISQAGAANLEMRGVTLRGVTVGAVEEVVVGMKT